LGLAFAPQVKFVKKCKDEAAAKTMGTIAAFDTKNRFDDKTESASETDAESSDDSTTSSDDDEQETGKRRKHEMTGVADFKTSVVEYDDECEDDELLLKKTDRSDKHLELQDSNKAAVEPAKFQVLLVHYHYVTCMLTHTHSHTLVYNHFT